MVVITYIPVLIYDLNYDGKFSFVGTSCHKGDTPNFYKFFVDHLLKSIPLLFQRAGKGHHSTCAQIPPVKNTFVYELSSYLCTVKTTPVFKYSISPHHFPNITPVLSCRWRIIFFGTLHTSRVSDLWLLLA